MKFKVTEIINFDTIKVSPMWSWKNPNGTILEGDILRIWGSFTPPHGTSAAKYAKEKLEKLLKDQLVDLRNPKIIIKQEEAKVSPIACDVYLNDVNIMLYFPEYKV
ncbi:MAG: hypothetical protein CVU05_02535 [Bacteroidetes bacterium HGW-Bacteroidetes-21]|jgi:hypothetical protein|nr:MAG: hypothetical protein CVU05_02535 [Bacteroidetes bacterium HGW-Bacteroidetes-21]